MSVDTSSRKTTATCSAVAAYPFTFRALTSAPTDIKCKLTVIATGVESDLTYTTAYTAAINSNGIGGTVTLVTTYGTTHKLTIYRETTDLQSSDYNDYNQFPADTLETDLDRRTMKSQELKEDMDRALKLSIVSTLSSLTLPDPSAGKALVWSGATIVNSTYAADSISTVAIAAATSATTSMNAAATSATAALASQVAAAASAAAIKQHIRCTLPFPSDFYSNVDTKVCLVSRLDAAITITNILCTCDADPTTEVTGDIKYATALIGTAGSILIGAFDTTAGVSTSGTISVTVGTTKCIYAVFDTAPDSAIKQIHWDLSFNY
jgi:hypothetical protein